MRLLVSGLLLISFSALACPDLSGSYPLCRSTTGGTAGSRDMVISQKMENGITTYILSYLEEDSQERVSEVIIADGEVRTHTGESESGPLQASTKASCQGEKLIYHSNLSVQDGEIAAINGTVVKSGQSLIQEMNGHIFGSPVSDQIICE